MLSEHRLEKLYGHLSHKGIEDARNNIFIAGMTGVSEGLCPVENVVQDFVSKQFEHEDTEVEVGVDSEQAEFYVDETQTSVVMPVSLALNDWMCTFARGEPVKEGVIYIGRDDTLPKEPLFLCIDYLLSAWDLVDFDNLNGMERRLTRKHITDGLKCHTGHCPVANVMSELFPHYQVRIDAEYFYIEDKLGRDIETLVITEQLCHWIDAYDSGSDVGTFTLIIKKRDDAIFEQEGYRYELGIKPLSESQKCLQNCISKLSELSAEIELENYYSDTDEDKVVRLTRIYQDLFSDTVDRYGN